MSKNNYRAWNGEKLIYSLLINFDGDDVTWLDGDLDGKDYHDWKEEGLMQYVDKQDINGDEICEGDIIKGSTYLGPVVFQDSSFGLRHLDFFIPFTDMEGLVFTILGNLYEIEDIEGIKI